MHLQEMIHIRSEETEDQSHFRIVCSEMVLQALKEAEPEHKDGILM